jgi:amidase
MRLTLALILVCATASAEPRDRGLTVVEATIPELQVALRSGRITSRELVMQYLARIATYEDKLNAVITVNPRALEEADALDRERQAAGKGQGKLRGPLHGIPIALKDNIHTTHLPTTGGALAFAGLVPPYQATVTKNLRDAGAIIIAKTQMTELANWVAANPPMPNNYNSLHGYGFNPYDPRRDPREATADGRPVLTTGGSSSGAGTAASFWAANVGTETSGSILSPANANMLAAVKPTLGRISRHGIIPITADQDTAGPMARTVTDAAILLGVLEGAGPDANDPATTRCLDGRKTARDYTVYLDKAGLKGARIGIPRAFYYDKVTPPGSDHPEGGLNDAQAKVMAEAIEILRKQGAIVVDPADIPSVVDKDRENNLLAWSVCSSMDEVKARRCSIDLAYGMERDFNKWLASLGPAAPVKTLAELRQWNTAHQKAGTLKYGQALLDLSDAMDLETFRARYESDRARDLKLTASHGIDEVMTANRLDALLFPGSSGANLAARPGYPTVIVPFGRVPNAPTPPFPDGFNAKPAAYGVSFTGSACGEPKLLKLGYAFEQATRRRVAPPDLP